MGPAAEVGRSMTGVRGQVSGVSFRICALLFGAVLAARAATFYVTLSGLGGEPDYEQRFKMWAEDIDTSLKRAGGDANVITMVAPTREQIRAKMGDVARQAHP